jgi:hypothetical protein
MREQTIDLWAPALDGAWRGITTNGVVRHDGACVMGRGCAREAKQRFPHLPYDLGSVIRKHGNIPWQFGPERLFSFPVKHAWHEPADPRLITASVAVLDRWAREAPEEVFYLPRPGCGNGQLRWEQVAPLCQGLPDNVVVITK